MRDENTSINVQAPPISARDYSTCCTPRAGFALWLYHRFNLSSRDIEDLMAERGIAISYESIRLWCLKFGPKYARRLRRRHQGFGDTFYLDEVFVRIQGLQHYLWRAIDQDCEVVDVFLQRRRDGVAAKRFFKRILRASGNEPRRIVTDKLRSYGVAHREFIPDTIHDTSQYANKRAELSHQPTRVRERGMLLQIDTSGPTVSEHSHGCLQSVQSGAAFDIGQKLSIFPTTRLCVLEMCGGLIKRAYTENFTSREVNLSVPL